ncbi:MAG TPA: hypothetical protein VEY14_07515 [Nocardioidaceae bacterium]|nr:hypothetical protein [Nocardioidaceae bacterium]
MSMRCYVPASRSMLLDLVEGRPVPAGMHAYAVTPALLAATAYPGGGPEDEEAEYAALMLAAEASVLQLDPADPADRRRVVLAIDADVEGTSPAGDPPGEVRLRQAVHRAEVAAVHVDTGDLSRQGGLIDRALASRDAGDDAGLERALDALAEVDLGWYAPSELDALV